LVAGLPATGFADGSGLPSVSDGGNGGKP
jgi:hypothetical protein